MKARLAPIAISSLLTLSCSFKPVHKKTEWRDFELGYTRPSAGQLDITYRALREHTLASFCVHLLKYRVGDLLSRNSGYVRGTPDHCFPSPGRTLKVGDAETYAFEFPRTDLLLDTRKDMGKVDFHIVCQSEPDGESNDYEFDL